MSIVARRFEFEGEELTIREIRERVPVLTGATIRHHLKNGRNTRQLMLAHDIHAARRRAGALGRAAAEAGGLKTSISAASPARANATASGFVGKP
jgi:hypothetical protein